MRRTAPIPALPQYGSDLEHRQRWTTDIFDRTAPHYDRICRMMSAGTDMRYRREALVRCGMTPGQRVLDVATGTGLLARAASTILGDPCRIVGSDLSRGMLREARAALGNPLVQARAETLPFRGASFDAVTLGYGLRHVADLESLFGDCHHVLCPGGRLVILEITKPPSRPLQALARAYFGRVVPFLSRIVTGSREAQVLMKYYWDTIDHCVPPETVVDALGRAGFVDVSRYVEKTLFSEYVAFKPVMASSSHEPTNPDLR